LFGSHRHTNGQKHTPAQLIGMDGKMSIGIDCGEVAAQAEEAANNGLPTGPVPATACTYF
jgi:hypothetical protein